MKTIGLKVLMPGKIVYEADVKSVIVRTTAGDIGFLAGHENCCAELDVGVLYARAADDSQERLMVLRGYATVLDNKVTVISPLAGHPEEIDGIMAGIKKEREENTALEKRSELEMHRMERALRQSLVRKDISSYAIIRGRMEKGDKD